ncbi:MAG: 2-amino-4-hydroxy-6-hydroxymethyldihydropteridine diphosphokinase [Bacteroidales bacterium]|nr:2-amino-4-hydroxy-6-hydroxymethyldihydropteridine diphosphokinase [Bacteroidales bacterium]
MCKTIDLYLSLGSNLGDRKALLNEAVKEIEQELGMVFAQSSFYETEPWGFNSDHFFLNIVVGVRTGLKPSEILRRSKEIEKRMGRGPVVKGMYEDRPIDIDLLFYGKEIMHDTALILPHPRLHLRRFVLDPLNEIAPDFMHPELNKTIRELRNELLSEEEHGTDKY